MADFGITTYQKKAIIVLKEVVGKGPTNGLHQGLREIVMKSMMPAWPLQVAITSTGAAAVVDGQWGEETEAAVVAGEEMEAAAD